MKHTIPLFVLAFVVLSLANCGRAEKQIVEVTRVVTATPPSTVEVVPTFTPTTFHTTATPIPVILKPTATPTQPPATPTLEPPAGWLSYKIISTDSTVWYPPNWEIISETSISVVLKNKQNQFELIAVNETPFLDPQVDHKEQIRQLKLAYLGHTNPLDIVTFFREGSLDAPFNPAYVTATYQDYVYKVTSGVLVTFITDGMRVAYVQYVKVGTPSISDNRIDMLTQMSTHYGWASEK